MTEGINSINFQTYNRSVMHYTSPEMRRRFDYDPPYQRPSVWDDQRRVDLIRSMLLGIPIGIIVLNNRGYSDDVTYAVVDGKQRVETLIKFRDDEFAVPAFFFGTDNIAADDVNEETDTVLYSELSIRGKSMFELLPIPSVEASVKGLAAEAEIFRLINTGGVEQTADTIEKARAIEDAR